MASTKPMISTIIAKTNGKDCVVDFRDRLSLAQPMDYATMHQLGGKNKDGYPSIIEMVICDFSKGTGANSVTVSANLEPSVLYEWYEICKATLGEASLAMMKRVWKNGSKPKKYEVVENELNNLCKAVYMNHRISSTVNTLMNGIRTLFRKIVKGKIVPGSEEKYLELGVCFKEAQNELLKPIECVKHLTFNRGVNYSYTQDKVNIYKQQPDGYAPVSRLTVQHQCFRSKDGDAADYPWFLKILKGEAVVEEKDTGATTFIADTLRNPTEACISVSDRDMFRMMTRVTHYIDCWENAMCIPLIIEGRKQREQEMQAYRDASNY